MIPIFVIDHPGSLKFEYENVLINYDWIQKNNEKYGRVYIKPNLNLSTEFLWYTVVLIEFLAKIIIIKYPIHYIIYNILNIHYDWISKCRDGYIIL